MKKAVILYASVHHKNTEKVVNYIASAIDADVKYSLQGTTQGRYLTGGVPPVRFSM